MVYVRVRGQRAVCPPGKITNLEFVDALHYIAKRESIFPGPSKDSLAKYLRDSRKYSQLQTDLEQGSLLPGDSWTALAKYLNLPPPPEEKKKKVQERQEAEE